MVVLFAAASMSALLLLLLLLLLSFKPDEESSSNCCFKRCTSRRRASSLNDMLLFSQQIASMLIPSSSSLNCREECQVLVFLTSHNIVSVVDSVGASLVDDDNTQNSLPTPKPASRHLLAQRCSSPLACFYPLGCWTDEVNCTLFLSTVNSPSPALSSPPTASNAATTRLGSHRALSRSLSSQSLLSLGLGPTPRAIRTRRRYN
jgi:hypothetical protein